MAMVYVPAGTFMMGSADDDPNADPDEKPLHAVTLDAFWMDRTEVSNDQYRICVESGVCLAPIACDWGDPTFEDASKSDHPVACVDWSAAADYCAWVEARLPTEAEWEYAARGIEQSAFPWGNTFDCRRGNFDDETEIDEGTVGGGAGCDGYDLAAPVGSFPAGESWCGVLDMTGNVWEWNSDWLATDYYDRSPTSNPAGPSSGDYRVVRGGGWFNIEDDLRVAHRGCNIPGFRTSDLGFRCVSDNPGE